MLFLEVNKMKIKNFFKNNWMFIVSGLVVGLVAVGLTALGNPKNMGFCIACFLRDIAGGLKLHSAAAVQYVRPEILGIVIGAFVISLIRKDFAPTGGSAPLTRFLLGVMVMIGALVFLGCPLRMMIRIGGGDVNAMFGLIGFVAGIGVGVLFLNMGFTLKRNYTLPKLEGLLAPATSAITFVLLALCAGGAITMFASSTTGPGSMTAPIAVAFIGALIVGAVGQRTRVCFVGGIRDSFMFRQFGMILCFAALLVTLIVGNLITGDFHLSMKNQPVAHTETLWNILGLFVVGLGSVFLGGCPFRQLVLAGSGNADSAITVVGMIVGGALAHNLGTASSAAGTTENGRIAVIVCIVILLAIGFLNRKKVAK